MGKIYQIFFSINVVCSLILLEAAEVCRNQPADIGFLLDESGSVGTSSFQNNLEAIVKFIDVFDIGPDALQISVFAFHENMGDGFFFNRCHDQTCIKSSVRGIRYYDGGQDFEMALEFAERQMFQKTNGMRDFSLKILILFTDGTSPIKDGGYPLRQLDVIVYAVGVGTGVDKDQLKKIATNDTYVFMIDSYNNLIGQVSQNIRNKACNDILSNPCDRNPQPCKNRGTCIPSGGAKYTCLCMADYTGHNCETVICRIYPSDVVFVIDSSKSFSSYYFDISKAYIHDVTKQWEITPTSFQIAIVSYANAAYIELPFDDTLTNDTFQDAVSNLTFRGGRSELHLGLQTAERLLTNRHRHVSHVPVKKFIILISDGLPSTPYAVTAFNSNNIETFAVAIGEDVSHNFLNIVTNGMDKVFPYHTDKLWHEMMHKLVNDKCGYCNSSNEVDLLFAVDTSAKMTNADLHVKVPSLLRKILSAVTIGADDTHIALLTYHQTTEIRFNFTDYPETRRTDLEKQLSYFEKDTDAATNITSIADVVQEMMLNNTFGARDTSKKVIVILSRFINTLDNAFRKIIQTLKDNNIEIFVIGFDFENDHFNTMSEIATTSLHIGVDDDSGVDTISTFLSGLHNQLRVVKCKLP